MRSGKRKEGGSSASGTCAGHFPYTAAATGTRCTTGVPSRGISFCSLYLEKGPSTSGTDIICSHCVIEAGEICSSLLQQEISGWQHGISHSDAGM